MLTLVPTPIGNLDDITFRSVKVLESVDLILAEDTRHAGRLLQHLEIKKPLRSYHAHNEHKVVEQLVEELQSGVEMALITDAGSPGISDPGFLLTRACIQAGIEVICLPGANAIIPALVGSGLPCDKFYFEGFLPVKKGRNTRLQYLSELEVTMVLYESPHKILKTLKQLVEVLGSDREACVAREISKLHEEFIRGSLTDILQNLEQRPKIKGEITLIVAGRGG